MTKNIKNAAIFHRILESIDKKGFEYNTFAAIFLLSVTFWSLPGRIGSGVLPRQVTDMVFRPYKQRGVVGYMEVRIHREHPPYKL